MFWVSMGTKEFTFWLESILTWIRSTISEWYRPVVYPYKLTRTLIRALFRNQATKPCSKNVFVTEAHAIPCFPKHGAQHDQTVSCDERHLLFGTTTSIYRLVHSHKCYGHGIVWAFGPLFVRSTRKCGIRSWGFPVIVLDFSASDPLFFS